MTPKAKKAAHKLQVSKEEQTTISKPHQTIQQPTPAKPTKSNETSLTEDTLRLPPSAHSVKIRFRERVVALTESSNIPEDEARRKVAHTIANDGLLLGQVICYLDNVHHDKTNGETFGTTRYGYLANVPEGEEYLEIQPIGPYGKELSPTIDVSLDNVVGTEPQLAKEPVMAEIKKRSSKNKSAKKAKTKAAATNGTNGHAGRAPAVINEVQLLRMPKEGEKLAKQPLAFLQALEGTRSKKLPFPDLLEAVEKSGVKTARPWDAIFRLRRKSLVEAKFIAVA